jgi:DNA-binding HxlR family transcriptional regulator
VLNDRLRELREAGILEWSEEGGYGVTERGRTLCRALEPMQAWAESWATKRS